MAAPDVFIIPPPSQKHSVGMVDSSLDTIFNTTDGRISSETTAVTIYSMYGDDDDSLPSTKVHIPLRKSPSGSRFGSNPDLVQTRSRSSSKGWINENIPTVNNIEEPKIEITQEVGAGPSAFRANRPITGNGNSTTLRASEDNTLAYESLLNASGLAVSTPDVRPQTAPTTSYRQASLHVPESNTSAPSLLPMSPPQLPGEDADAYYVRATYAALDYSGVKGDGYEEGEELTRARLGPGRAERPPSPLPPIPGRSLHRREQEILEKADRYGFFSIQTAERVLLLPAAALNRPLSRIRQSSTSTPPSPPQYETPSTVPPPDRATEMRRIAKWERMLVPSVRDSGANVSTWTINSRKMRKFHERVYKGIPDRWRSAAWWMMIENMGGRKNQRAETLAVHYRDGIEQASSFDVQIDLDVPRTINGHVMFKTRYGLGQRSMFHVLHSFSLICPQCGYVQGMGPLTATLLNYLEPERVYAALVRIHDNYGMHSIFAPGFPGLLEAFYVQERILETMLPGVYAIFKKNLISTTSYAVKWYITLFANTVSFQVQLRLWDIFFLEGRDVIILMAVAILWVFKDALMSTSASFETILGLLSSDFVVEDEDALFYWLQRAMEDRRLRRNMNQWREDWQKLVSTGADKDVLL